jgi:putative ABC transport system ATP-binding protein
METSIYAFLHKYSWRQQLSILGLALALLPLNYASLELPKTIINRALGTDMPPVLFGHSFERLELLWLLCGIFLAVVLLSGGIKYVLNVYAGVVSERMLRRLRYQLYTHLLRFPLPHFRRVSQGELVQMINAETEALGGFIGEAVSTPAVQGGLLLTSLVFIFVQDAVLGLAAISLYPIQIYLIPKLQAQVNELGKRRVQQVRRNAERISETVSGAREIHAHAAEAYEQARFSQQLGQIFWIRFAIYKKKFLIKFINNFIAQLGPFFFFSIGGYLVLQGSISLGALVAVIGAHKDITAPWKELLSFYQTLFDVKIKYDQTVSQFVPAGLRDESYFEAEPTEPFAFGGMLRAVNITVSDDLGHPIVDGASFAVELPSRIAICGPAGSGKEELALTLAGLIAPNSGRVLVGQQDLHRQPAKALGPLLTFVGNPSYVFGGTIADNLLYGLKRHPVAEPTVPPELENRYSREQLEARLAGNSPFSAEADWVDFEALGVTTPEERLAVMMRALELALLGDDVYGLGLRSVLPGEPEPDLVRRILEARATMEACLAEDQRLQRLVERFDPGAYNSNATLAENLLFGTPIGSTFDFAHLPRHPYVLQTLRATGLHDELERMGLKVAQTMVELFADLPPDHEYFRQFSFIEPEALGDYRTLVGRANPDRLDELGAEDRERLLALPFRLIASRHRLGLLTDALEAKILEARAYFRKHLPPELAGAIDFFEPDKFNRASTLQENILFGKVAYGQAQAGRKIGALIDEVADRLGLRPSIAEVGLSSECGMGGSRLSPAQRQKLAIARAILKRPKVLVLYDPTGPLDPGEQSRVRDNILAEFAGHTIIWAVQQAEWAELFDLILELDDGRLSIRGEGGVAGEDAHAPPEAVATAS